MNDNTVIKVAGYEIRDRIRLHDKYGDISNIVLGYNRNAAAPWVTWRYFEEHDNYEFGHYFMNEENAKIDLFERAISLTNVDLRRNYTEENQLEDIKLALKNRYLEKDISLLLSDIEFKEKALAAHDSLDYSDLNESLNEKLNCVIYSTQERIHDILGREDYVIRLTSISDSYVKYIHVRDIKKEEIVSLFEGQSMFTDFIDDEIENSLAKAGAIILCTWVEDLSLYHDMEPKEYYDFEYNKDSYMLFDSSGKKLIEPAAQPSFILDTGDYHFDQIENELSLDKKR